MHQEYPGISTWVLPRQAAAKSFFQPAGFQETDINFTTFSRPPLFLLFKSPLVLSDHSGYYVRQNMEECGIMWCEAW